MPKARVYWPFLLLLVAGFSTAIVATISGRRAHEAQAMERSCEEAARTYLSGGHAVAGRLTAIRGHYDGSRHECLVEMSSVKPERGGQSFYDEILDAKSGKFIASRSRDVGEKETLNDAVIMGAPVSLTNTAGAESWFEGLMK